MSVDREIQVVVVGAGVAGLSLAGFLRRAGIEPVVIETADAFDERGVVELWPETMKLLDRLGVAGELRDVGTVVTEWTRRRPDGTVLNSLDTDGPGGFVVVPYERLREALVRGIDPSSVRMGTTLRSVEPTRHPVTVTFEDGVCEKFDLVVGADGVHSRTRALLGGTPPVACGTTTWTFPLPRETEFSGASELRTADGTVFRVLPVGDRPMGLLTVPGDGSGDDEATPTVPTDPGAGIDWVLPEALEAVDPDEVRSDVDVRNPSDLRRAGRVALVGAAARSLHRLSGLGPTLAIEDAGVLVSELVGRDDALAARLADYAVRRQSRTDRLPDGPGQESPLPASDSVDGTVEGACSRSLGIRREQLATAFGPETPQPAVGPLRLER